MMDNTSMVAAERLDIKSTTNNSANGPIMAEKGSVIDLKAGGRHHTNRYGADIDIVTVQPGTDPVYEAKIALVNEAILDIGMGKYQWCLYGLTGFGWLVDNLWGYAISNIAVPVRAEFEVKRIAFLSVGFYVGLILGSTLFPMAADFIGRKWSFNISLVLVGCAGIVGGGMPNFAGVTTIAAFIGLALGGNQPVDTMIFIEMIPASHSYLLVVQGAFWALGKFIAGGIAWPLIANYSCPSGTAAGLCSYYQTITWAGALTTFLSLLRFIFNLHETPKYLLGRGKDAEAVAVLQKIAKFNSSTTWLTLEHLQTIDEQLAAGGYESPITAGEVSKRSLASRSLEWVRPDKIRALFCTPKMIWSSSLILLLWGLIGMAYPLFNSYILIYLAAKGVKHHSSISSTYRTYLIAAAVALPASLISGFMVDVKYLGRKGTAGIGALLLGVFLYLFTQATSDPSILGFTCAIGFFFNFVFGILFAYTPELFPAPNRGTGMGLAGASYRLMGLAATLIASFAGVDNNVPIWLCAGLFIVAGFVFFLLPYEVRGRAAS